ncbi:MAG: glycosyltransferase family 4 protein [Actinobacteria bacterium]|nr:glycosyltransferase family 4 protein [Actinomycetota bacterium]
MRVGIVTTWFERGAAYVSRQYREVLNNWDGPTVTWAKKVPSLVPTKVDLEDFQQWLIHNRIQIVFFNEQWWWPAIILARKLKVITGAYIDYYTQQTIEFFALYDFLICNTRKHFSAFSWHPGVTYIPWGTDLTTFQPIENSSAHPQVVTFFHSGGISPQRKGCDLVLRAFHALRGDSKLVIHAQQRLRAVFPNLVDVIDELVAAGRLEIHERTVSAPGLFHMGDVYVYPTRLEGIGLTILEAAACGLPVIATDYGPMNEFVKHGDNGRVVEVERLVARPDGYYWPQAFVSLQSLVEQMQWYVDNVHLLPQLKARARYVAERDFDWRLSADGVLAAFSSADIREVAGYGRIEREIMQFERTQEALYRIDNADYLKRRIQIDYPTIYKFLTRISGLLKGRVQASSNSKPA